MNKKLKSIILITQTILILVGTVLAIVLLARAIKNPSLLGVVGAISYLITYLAIIFYTTNNYNKKENIYFQGVIYAYAAVIGIQILQAGNYISDFGMAENAVMLINCCNLISFANIIKFADTLDSKKIALAYMTIAVVLKLIVEICLIIAMIAFVKPIHILLSLSIPMLGITIIVAYIYRMKRFS